MARLSVADLNFLSRLFGGTLSSRPVLAGVVFLSRLFGGTLFKTYHQSESQFLSRLFGGTQSHAGVTHGLSFLSRLFGGTHAALQTMNAAFLSKPPIRRNTAQIRPYILQNKGFWRI